MLDSDQDQMNTDPKHWQVLFGLGWFFLAMIRISVAQLYMEPLSYLVLLKHTIALLVVYFEYFLVQQINN
jgi:hypothetical protein